MEKVLVTGADGFIGSHLAETLARRGIPVRALVYYNSPGSWGWLERSPPELLARMEVIPGDVRDEGLLRIAMQDCDTVFHLAALIGIPFSYQSPRLYLETNIHGTLNALEAARALGVRRFIQTSTSEVYGSAQTVPISEDHPLRAQSPYAATKVGADQLALSYHLSFGTPVSVVRPFNTYGPRQSLRAVIPTIIAQVAAGGTSIRLGNLESTRDFNFVADTVSGFIAAAEAPAETALGEVFNIGSGHEISIRDLVREIAGVMGREIHVEAEAERMRPDKSEVNRLLADASKAKRMLAWKPAYAGPEGLRRGLAETAKWFSEPANLAAYKTGSYAV